MAPFVGRDAELRQLTDVFRQATSGRLRVALLEGEAGIGKSRLAAEAMPAAEAVGFETYVGRCSDLDGGRAFAPLLDAFGIVRGNPDPERAELAASIAGEADTLRISDGIVDLIEATALRRPVLLVIEDLHWSDEATLATLGRFGRRLRYIPLAVVCTRRPAPPVPMLDRTLHTLRDVAWEIPLAPLDDGAVKDLADAIGGAELTHAIFDTLKGARGNPLFLTELLAVLTQEGAIPDLRSVPRMLPLLRRLSILSEQAIGVLRLAAIIGSAFDPNELATVAAQPLATLLPALDECLGARVLEPTDGPWLRFRHDLIREALYHDLPETIRKGLHLETARALVTRNATVERIAEHYAIGAQPGDASAIDALRRAARATRAGSSRIRLLERAIALKLEVDDERDELLATLAEAHVFGGRSDTGETLARELLERSWHRPLGRRVRAALLRAMRFQARWQELIQLVEEWRSHDHLADDERASILASQAFACAFAFGDRSLACIDMGERALAIGERLGDERVIFEASYALSAAYGRQADPREGEAARRALDLAAGNPDLLRDHPVLAVAMALMAGGREEDAREAFMEARRAGDESGTAWDQHMNRALLARLHLQLGEWDAAHAEAEAAIEATNETGVAMGLVTARLVLAHVLLWRKDDPEAAEAELDAVDSIIAAKGPQWGNPGTLRWVLAWARGDLTSAFHAGHAYLKEMRRIPRLGMPIDLVMLALMLGNDDDAATITRMVEQEILHRADSSYARASRGWGPAKAGRGDHFTEAMGQLVAVCRTMTSGDPDALARLVQPNEGLHMAAGGAVAWLYARRGDKVEAKAWLKRTVGALEADENRLRARLMIEALKQEGIVIRRRSSNRPLTGWEALTDTERRVALHAAEGLTNPQIGERLFISRRTVQAHLSHVFAKLGFSSRVQLASEVARRASTDD